MSSTTAPPAKLLEVQLPPYSWRTLSPSAQLLYIQTEKEANEAVSLLETDIVGFDLEWKPTFSKYQPENPVALVQIANNDYILLIQISRMREFPKKLKEYLQNPDILKAGVGIQKDVTKLFRDHGVATRSCVDLALLARSVDNAKWKGYYTNPIGLARLVQTYEYLAMEKGKITRSNWERILNPKQQEYAGNDAHAGFVLYTRLEDMKNNMAIVPGNECYMFDCFMGILCHPSGARWAPQNPDYDPGPPPPPRVKKEKPSPDSAAQTDPNAQSGNTVSPESPPKIGEIVNQPALQADSLVQQRSTSSTTLPISENRNVRPLASAGVSVIIPNPSTAAQSPSQRQAEAPPAHRRRRFRGRKGPQQGETAIPEGLSQRGGHRNDWGGSISG